MSVIPPSNLFGKKKKSGTKPAPRRTVAFPASGPISVEALAKLLKCRQADVIKHAWALGEFGLTVVCREKMSWPLAVKIAEHAGFEVLAGPGMQPVQIDDGATPQDLAPGVYEHYKGEKYLVLGVAGSSDEVNEGELMVVYVCLYTSKGGPYLRVRSLKEFTEQVKWPNDGVTRARFRFIGAR